MFGRQLRRRNTEALTAALGDGAKPTAREDRPSAFRLWSDGLGYLGTRSLQIIIVLTLTAGLIWGMRQVSLVVIPVLLALIFASTFAPVMRVLRRKNVPDVLATVIVLLGIVLLLTGIGWLIVWAVKDQWDELASQAQDGFTELVNTIPQLPFAPDQDQLLEWRDQFVNWATDFLTSSQFGSGAIAGVSAVGSFVTGLVLMIVVLFFFLKDGPKIWRFLLRPFEGAYRERAQRVGGKVVQTLGSYVRGTASVAAVDAIGILIGLLILGVPLAVPLAVLVFLLAFIPIVGATLAGTLAALVALVSDGFVTAIIVVGIVVLVNQLEGNFLQPVLMGRALKLHSLVILLALTVGTVLSGVLGAVLAVPIAAVAWGIVKVWDGPETPAKWARPSPAEVEQ